MTKHIAETTRDRDSRIKSAQYARIDATERPAKQTKALQRRLQTSDTQTRTKRFLDIARQGTGQ